MKYTTSIGNHAIGLIVSAPAARPILAKFSNTNNASTINP